MERQRSPIPLDRELADNELQNSFPALYRARQAVTDSSPSRLIDRVAQRIHDSTVLTTATGPIANVGRITEPSLLRQLLQTTTTSRSTQSRTSSTTAVVGSRDLEPYGTMPSVTSPTATRCTGQLQSSQNQPLTHTSNAQSYTNTGQLRYLTNTQNSFGSSLRQLRPVHGTQLHLANASGRMQLSHTAPTETVEGIHLGGQLRSVERFSPYPTYSYHRDYIRARNSSRGKLPTKQPQRGRKFTRSVVMVDRLDKKIPRGYRRSLLQQKGFIVSFIDFWTNWSEKDVQDAIEDAFSGAIDKQYPYPRFDFLQSCEGNLVFPTLPQAHVWTGDKIHRLAGQGCLYICPTYDCLIARDDEDDSGMCDKDSHSGDQSLETSEELQAQPQTEELSVVQKLIEMFPSRDPADLTEVLEVSKGDISNAVELLLDSEDEGGSIHEPISYQPFSDQRPCSSSSISTSAALTSLESILQDASQEIDYTSPIEVVIDRDRFWRNGLSFYKSSLSNKKRLLQDFHVEFKEEEGIDAGALKLDFFELMLQEINNQLFTGLPTRRIPKKDWALEGMFELAGVIIAHSIIHGGPSFPCLSPAVFDYIIYGEIDRALSGLSVKDIPLNAATSLLLQFLEKLDAASSNEDIDSLLNDQEYMTLVNTSRWSITDSINIQSKNILIQGLIIDEVLGKRSCQMDSFRKGLGMLGVLSLCQKYPQQLQCLFVYKETKVQFSTFEKLIIVPDEKDERKTEVFEWFLMYLKARESEETGPEMEGKTKANLGDILKFMTGLRTVPPMGYALKRKLRFSFNVRKHPESASCFLRVTLPLECISFEEFCSNFDKSVLWSLSHYGQM